MQSYPLITHTFKNAQWVRFFQCSPGVTLSYGRHTFSFVSRQMSVLPHCDDRNKHDEWRSRSVRILSQQHHKTNPSCCPWYGEQKTPKMFVCRLGTIIGHLIPPWGLQHASAAENPAHKKNDRNPIGSHHYVGGPNYSFLTMMVVMEMRWWEMCLCSTLQNIKSRIYVIIMSLYYKATGAAKVLTNCREDR